MKTLLPESITAVILAGGFGTRIKHLLGDLPKPMAPVQDRPFVEWIVRYLAVQKIRNVILSTGHLAETVADHFAKAPVKNVRVRCVPETIPLGTAGGFLNARTVATEKTAAWLVLNGDSLAPAPLAELFAALEDAQIDGALLGVRVPDAARFGTLALDAQNRLAGFSEKKPGAGIINAGVYLFRDRTLAQFPAQRPLSLETEVFPALLQAGARFQVCVTDAPFLDIGTPESLPLAERFIRENKNQFEL